MGWILQKRLDNRGDDGWDGAMTEPFVILTICTGNICRSPAMERLLAHRLADDAEAGGTGTRGVEVRSAGVFAHVGEEMKEPMRRRVAACGADAEGTAATQVDAELIEDADLILTATREHRRELLRDAPDAGERIFTLREAARLLTAVERSRLGDMPADRAARLTALVPLLQQARAASHTSADDDILDPYMRGEAAYDESFAQLRAPIEALSRFVS